MFCYLIIYKRFSYFNLFISGCNEPLKTCLLASLDSVIDQECLNYPCNINKGKIVAEELKH